MSSAWLNRIKLRLKALFLRRQLERDLEDELAFHLAMREQQLRDSAAQLAPGEARSAARRQFGNATYLREECRTMWTFAWVETLWQDVRFGLRTLRKNPAFTAVAVVTLALGIGANTAIYSVVDRVLLRPLPYPDPGELVAARQNDSLMNVIDIERQNRAFSTGGGANLMPMDYTGGSEPVQVHAALVNAGMLKTLGVPPMLGRLIAPEEDVKGGPQIVVLSHHFWQQFLGSDPGALGTSIPLSGNTYTVIGVMPPGFDLPEGHADLFVSLWVGYAEAAPYRGVHFMRTVWRLRPGVTLAQAQADMDAIDRHLAADYPDTERDRQTVLVPLQKLLTGNVRPALLILFAAVGLVLLIACANFAGLLMARAIARQREFVIRASLGAGRSRLVRQSLTECLLLAIFGGAAGLALAWWGTSLLVSLEPPELERFRGIQMDAHLFLFVFCASVLIGVLVGIAPALPAAGANAAESLKEGSRSTTAGPASHTLHSALIAGEFALALILLAGAGLLIKGFSLLSAVNPGFNPAGVLTMQLQLPATRYAEIPSQIQFRRQLLEHLNALPGVRAAMVTDLPLGGNYLSHRIVIDGRSPVPSGAEPHVQTLSVMGDYFRVMQIPIRSGRGFTDMDREGQPLVAVVNEAFVRRFFSHQDPIGGRLDWTRSQTSHVWMTIIGVAQDVKQSGLSEDPDPAVYAPFAQSDEPWRRWMALVIRTPGPPGSLVETVKKQVWRADHELPINKIQSMEDVMRISLAQRRFNMLLLGAFAALALALAAVGIYGMMAYRVSQRTHEIGIRIALGALRRDVLWLTVGEGARLAFVGLVLGIAGAFWLTRWMASLLFQVTPTDPATFGCVTLLLAAVALVACYLPARRAARLDPAITLRHNQ